MTWTTEKPTRPGWYWLDRRPICSAVDMVRVNVGSAGQRYVLTGTGFSMQMESVTGQWAGPIEPPE